MSNANEGQNRPNIVNQPHIERITGPVHAGVGNQNIQNANIGHIDAISSKDDFLAALQELKANIEALHEQGIAEEATDDIIIEVEAAERETNRSAPQPKRIIQRLENAKALITAGAGLATTAITSADRLIPLLENAIHAVTRLF